MNEIVRMQNLKTKKWDTLGEIVAVRTANDGRIVSYDIECDGSVDTASI